MHCKDCVHFTPLLSCPHLLYRDVFLSLGVKMELAGSPNGALPVNLWGPLSALACMNNPLAQQPAVTRAGGQRGTPGGDLAPFGSPPVQPSPEGDVAQPLLSSGTRCSACPGLPTGLDTPGHKDGEPVRDTEGSPQWQEEQRRKRLLQHCVNVIWREKEQKIKLDRRNTK